MMRFVWIGCLGLAACQATLEVGGSLPPGPTPNNRDGSIFDGSDAGLDGGSLDLGFDDRGAPIDGGLDVDATITDATQADLGIEDDAGPANDAGPSTIFQGSFVITNEIDRRTIWAYAEITGDLAIRAPGMTDTELPNLERIGGHLLVEGNTDLLRLALPQLVEIGTDFKIYDDPRLEDLELPLLVRVGEDLRVGLTTALTARTNPKLVVIDLPSLEEVGGELQIRANGVSLLQDPTLMLGLAAIRLPRLESVGYGLEIVDNNALLDFDLSALTRADERICVGIGNCLKIHDVTVSGNLHLPECRVTALFAQLRARSYAGDLYTGYNDDDGICN
jgi:hypothetical protein